MKSKRQSKDYMFVGIQLLLFVGYLLPFSIISFQLPLIFRWIALGVGLCGILILLLALLHLNRNLTPFPTPKANAQLITSGLYQYVRHPIYSGILAIVFGFGMYQGNFFKIIVSFLLLGLFYFKTEFEETLLAKKFENYDTYRRKTGRFWPFLK
jgi:protein-S-isoprenylcysteine O-methyltransferase Ste14